MHEKLPVPSRYIILEIHKKIFFYSVQLLAKRLSTAKKPADVFHTI